MYKTDNLRYGKIIVPHVYIMEEKISQIITEHEQRFGGRIGLYAENLATGKATAHRQDEAFGTASIIKVPLLIAYFKKCEEGTFDFSASVTQKKEYLFDIPDEAGFMKKIPEGTPVPIEAAAMLMIYLSDNTATNVFLRDFVPKQLFNEMMQGMGYGSTRLTIDMLNSEVFTGSTEDIGYSTPRELARILGDAMLHKSIRQTYGDKLLEYMAMNYLSPRLTRGLPHETRLGSGALIKRYGSKAGTYTRHQTINDLAYIITKTGEQIVIACTMNGLSDEGGVRQSAVDSMQNRLFGTLGELAFQAIT